MRTTFNLAVIATFLLVGISVFYYFVIFLPGKESARASQEATKQKEQQYNLNSCLREAYLSYTVRWNDTCKLDGKKEECVLPKYRSDDVNGYHKELKDECFKKYPQN